VKISSYNISPPIPHPLYSHPKNGYNLGNQNRIQNKEVKTEMYCPQCGEKIPDDAKFCPKCGAALKAKAERAPAPAPAATGERTSGLAIASLILGILGISILAIIFGAIAISQTNKDPYLKGKGMAVAGLVLGILGMVVVVFWIIAAAVWSASFWWWW
jgi:hypothetical protein